MSNIGVHDFAIPHEYVQPTRDMVVIKMPSPPKQSAGGIELPDVFRDIAAHNVMAGRIVSMGPLAFKYKDGSEELASHNVNVGDWVVIRPYAGTMMQGRVINGIGGYRYVSSFQDVIAVIPADRMPDPKTLLWTDSEENKPAKQQPKPEEFGNGPRERVTVGKD